MAETKQDPLAKYQFLRSTGRFTRMRTRGAIPPPFAVIQVVTELVMRQYQAEIEALKKEAVQAGAHFGVSLGVSDADAADLDLFLDAMRERVGRRVKGDVVDANTVSMVKKQLLDAQVEFFREFQDDADEETQARVVNAFTRGETFNGRLDVVREAYLRTAIERITEGKSQIRKTFIYLFGDWITGVSGDLKGLDSVMDEVSKEAGTFSRFFARDQFSRFNRALTLATYQEAGAKWVQWVTVSDQRVRKSHRQLQNKIFRIDDLPEEYLDYLCRCSLIPVYDLRGRTVTRGDGIAFAA